MSHIDVFKRYEYKYMLDADSKAKLLEVLDGHMKLDEYGRTTIRNVYYDTPDYALIRKSLEKPVYKEKLRVRSAPGTAREITAVFLAMATGLICGMGYFVYAGIFTAIICVAMMLLKVTGFGNSKDEKELHITIPEDLDYEGVFDEIFDKYTSERKLISVKTSDMGSLFRLKYTVTIKNGMREKDFIDKLRVRNGNLPITVCISQLTESSAQL